MILQKNVVNLQRLPQNNLEKQNIFRILTYNIKIKDMKTFKKLEIPLYLLIIALMTYETNLILAIILLGLSVFRLVLNSWGFDQFYNELSDEVNKNNKNKK